VFNFLRRRPSAPEPEPPTPEELRELREQEAIENVKVAIDMINAEMPHLPRGMSPWMDWSGLPHTGPRLRLKQRRYERDTIIYG
jgi:hypothetical protein